MGEMRKLERQQIARMIAQDRLPMPCRGHQIALDPGRKRRRMAALAPGSTAPVDQVPHRFQALGGLALERRHREHLEEIAAQDGGHDEVLIGAERLFQVIAGIETETHVVVERIVQMPRGIRAGDGKFKPAAIRDHASPRLCFSCSAAKSSGIRLPSKSRNN